MYVLLGRCLHINREPCPPKSRQAISYNHTLRLIARFAKPAAPLIFIYYPYSGASYREVVVYMLEQIEALAFANKHQGILVL